MADAALAARPMRAVLDEPGLRSWGERIGREVEVPVVLALHGDLGSGKSTLARAVARGAGVQGSVPSPTFNLLFVYDAARARVKHLDLYRLAHADEVWELGWEELGADPDLVLIEWAERAGDLLPARRWDVTLEQADAAETRFVTAEPVGDPPALPRPPG